MVRQRVRLVLLWLFIVLCGATLVTVLLGRRAPPLSDPVEQGDVLADAALQHFQYSEIRDGRTFWSLEGETALYQLELDRVELQPVTLILPRADGILRLVAQSGTAWPNEQRITLEGAVELTRPDGYRVRCDRLLFEGTVGSEGQLSSDAAVELSGPQLQLSGSGLRYDLAQRQLHLQQAVRATLVPRPQEARR